MAVTARAGGRIIKISTVFSIVTTVFKLIISLYGNYIVIFDVKFSPCRFLLEQMLFPAHAAVIHERGKRISDRYRFTIYFMFATFR